MEDFSWGVANRGASIRVGRTVPVDKCGYYEVRSRSNWLGNCYGMMVYGCQCILHILHTLPICSPEEAQHPPPCCA